MVTFKLLVRDVQSDLSLRWVLIATCAFCLTDVQSDLNIQREYMITCSLVLRVYAV